MRASPVRFELNPIDFSAGRPFWRLVGDLGCFWHQRKETDCLEMLPRKFLGEFTKTSLVWTSTRGLYVEK
ncbi:hypothetical protein R1flu_004490 [Riccia fluitans]|uniref:Uncharacterized protein n=1 Tax=Riccia fluitans TaxID=41844 RepID=A0ABD1YQF8_9MARC